MKKVGIFAKVEDTPEEALARAHDVEVLKARLAARPTKSAVGHAMKAPWVFDQVVVGPALAPPDECAGEVSVTGDGGCTYGRSWAQGPVKLRDLVNHQDYQREMAQRLAGGVSQRISLTVNSSQPLPDPTKGWLDSLEDHSRFVPTAEPVVRWLAWK